METLKKTVSLVNDILDIPGKIIAFVTILAPASLAIFKSNLVYEIHVWKIILIILTSSLISWICAMFFSGSVLGFKGRTVLRNWDRLKSIIRKYNKNQNLTVKQKNSLEKEYVILRSYFMLIVARYDVQITEHLRLQNPSATKYAAVLKNNFQSIFSSAMLGNWYGQGRNVDNEIDCFDSIIAFISIQ